MWNNKKRSRASPTRCGVGAEVCSVNKMRPLMYERADFSRWENDTHCIFHRITVCNILCLCRNIIQTAFQNQTSQICSEDLASVRLLLLPGKTKVRVRTPLKCSHMILAVTSLFIHFFSLHTQRIFFYDALNQIITNRLICLNPSGLHSCGWGLFKKLLILCGWLTDRSSGFLLRVPCFFSSYLRCWV